MGGKKNVQGNEIFCRMNLLYQASTLYAGQNNTLSSYYGSLMHAIARKATVKIDPNVKRTLCKRCCLAQAPGLTADMICTTIQRSARNRRRRKKKASEINEEADFFIKCRSCGYERKLSVKNDYNLRAENPEAVTVTIPTTEMGVNNPETIQPSSQNTAKRVKREILNLQDQNVGTNKEFNS